MAIRTVDFRGCLKVTVEDGDYTTIPSQIKNTSLGGVVL